MKAFKTKAFILKALLNGKAVIFGLNHQNCHRAIMGFLGDGIYTLFFMVYSRDIH
jgi:hypothetical protein